MSFPFSRRIYSAAFAGCGKDCGAYPVILSIIHSVVWSSTKGQPFPSSGLYLHGQPHRIHSPVRASALPSVPRHDRGRRAMPGLRILRNCFNVQPSGTVWCRQVATTVLRRVIHNYFSLCEVMIMAETDAPTGRLPPLTNGFQQIFLFLFAGLTKRVFAEPSAGATLCPCHLFAS